MENTYTHAKTHSLDFINKQMDKKGLNKLLAQIYLEFGGAKTAKRPGHVRYFCDIIIA